MEIISPVLVSPTRFAATLEMKVATRFMARGRPTRWRLAGGIAAARSFQALMRMRG